VKLRDKQIALFADRALQTFEDELVEHIKEFAPRHTAVLQEAGTRRVVQLGVRRAREYGFTSRGPVRFHLELMFTLGSSFDTDPQLPWASSILTDENVSNQVERADRLYEASATYLDEVAGPDYEYGLDALRRLSRADVASLVPPRGDLETKARVALREIYPRKCDYLGSAGVRKVVEHGVDLARIHAISSEEGTALLIALTFALGHGIVTDPLYPWIGATLGTQLVADPNDRARRLRDKAMLYLRRALAYLEEV